MAPKARRDPVQRDSLLIFDKDLMVEDEDTETSEGIAAICVHMCVCW